jgi:hypothetical protein
MAGNDKRKRLRNGQDSVETGTEIVSFAMFIDVLRREGVEGVDDTFSALIKDDGQGDQGGGDDSLLP